MIKKFKSLLTIAVAVALCGAISVSSCSSKSASGNDSTASEATQGEGSDAVADSIAKAIAEIQPEFNKDLPFQQLASAAVVLRKYREAGASQTVMDSLKAHVMTFEEGLKNMPVTYESTSRGAVKIEGAHVKGIKAENIQVVLYVKFIPPKVEENIKRVIVAVDKDNKIISKTVTMFTADQKHYVHHFYLQNMEDANIVKFIVCEDVEVEGKNKGDQCPL